MKEFGKFARYCGAVLGIAVVMIACAFLAIVVTPQGVFDPTYQAVIQRKYEKLLQTDTQKIILVGGSNLAFGMDEEYLENATGYQVVNLGLHAGFGHKFNAELAKGNINPGDVVVIAFEYGWIDAMDDMDIDLVMSGIDQNLSMYKHVPLDKYPDVLGNLFTYASKKRVQGECYGVYSASAFDAEGKMIFDRPNAEGILDYANKKNLYGTVDVSAGITEESAEFVREFKAYVEKQGASVYFAAAPVLKDAVECTEEELLIYEKAIVEKTGVTYISNTADYRFPVELMYDTIYHCNNAGEQYRTKLLAQDLINAGICLH